MDRDSFHSTTSTADSAASAPAPASGFEARRDVGLAAAWLFFRRFLVHPALLATALPSSRAMARMVAAQVRRSPGQYVVELGAGTGAVTEALIDAGVPAERLVVVEIDEEMASFLDEAFPGVTVIHGSAAEIASLLPEEARGRVGEIVCGVPVSLLGYDDQKAMVDAMLAVLPEGERFLAYTYRPASPLPMARLRLSGRRVGFTLRNVMPASVWAYRRNG